LLNTRRSLISTSDAGFLGNTLTPDNAFRFARGEEITASGAMRTQLVPPLGFLVVTDHAEYFGLASQLINGDQALLDDPIGKRWYDMFHGSSHGGDAIFQEIVQGCVTAQPQELISNPAAKRSAWKRHIALAEANYEPGKFSAFIGFGPRI